MNSDHLSGPVSICIDRPVLSLDRAFTYALSESLEAGVGSLVKVPFHGRPVKGWVLGPTDDFPKRMLEVTSVESDVRFFDETALRLLQWTSDRYVSPLATVIGRSHPPRVVSEEDPNLSEHGPGDFNSPNPQPPTFAERLHASYKNGSLLAEAVGSGRGTFVLRPAPTDEVALAVETVARSLAGGRRAIVLVPESDPVPATATAMIESFGNRVALFMGKQSKRARYRMWLDIKAGKYDVVVGTRPAVFAPVAHLGLVFVSRESHANHREERSPYFHVREVAVERGQIESAATVLSAMCPTSEASEIGGIEVGPVRRMWPAVEVVPPGPEGRAQRLVTALRSSSGAFLYEPLPGYGIASVCRDCSSPAVCAACSGMLRAESGRVTCTVCGAPGRCASCNSTNFGIRKGGSERVEEWAGRSTSLPVHREPADRPPHVPVKGDITIGGPESVKDFGPVSLDLVGILDADLALRRPGLASLERSLAIWMEAAAWAWPGGRVVVQSHHSREPVMQSLVAGNPARFHRSERARRKEAGFPVGCPVFRVAGTDAVPIRLDTLQPVTLLTTAAKEETICLVVLTLDRVPAFGRAMRTLAQEGIVTRVEAEPHL